MKKSKLKTFGSLYQISVKSKEKSNTVKAARKLLQRLLTAANAGRSVEIGNILKHELSPVPLSLAKVGGTMNPTTKSDLMNLFTNEIIINVPEVLPESNLLTCNIWILCRCDYQKYPKEL